MAPQGEKKHSPLAKLFSCFGGGHKKHAAPAKPQTQQAQQPQTAPRRVPRPRGRNSVGDAAERYGVKSQFQAIKFAGKGAAGDVWVCRDLRTQEVVAIKFMKRPISSGNQPLVARELKIHSLLSEGHVNVIKAYDALLTTSHLGLIMEYAAGGNLTSYVGRKWERSKTTGLFCSEDEARFFFRQFVSAVHYCHKHCVAHRDLKLDNVLLDGSDPPVLKLTDFGYAKTWTGMGRNTTHIGTPVYMSPELINAEGRAGQYDPKTVDVWASGILLIVMLLGVFPYDHTKNPDPNSFDAQYEVWQQEVTEKWYESPFVAGKASRLSTGCRDLLDRIFIVDPIKRITIPEIMGHAWYNDPLPAKYQRVLDDLEAQQRALDERMAARQIDQDLVDQRNEALDFLVKEASRRATQQTMSDMASLQIVDYRRNDIKHVALTDAAILVGATPDYGSVLTPPKAPGDSAPGSARHASSDAEGLSRAGTAASGPATVTSSGPASAAAAGAGALSAPSNGVGSSGSGSGVVEGSGAVGGAGGRSVVRRATIRNIDEVDGLDHAALATSASAAAAAVAATGSPSAGAGAGAGSAAAAAAGAASAAEPPPAPSSVDGSVRSGKSAPGAAAMEYVAATKAAAAKRQQQQ